MSLSYNDIYNMAVGCEMKPRAIACVGLLAHGIVEEDPQTENHTNRLIWAKWAIENTEDAACQMKWGVLSNADMQTDPSQVDDAAMRWIFSSLINNYANLKAAEVASA